MKQFREEKIYIAAVSAAAVILCVTAFLVLKRKVVMNWAQNQLDYVREKWKEFQWERFKAAGNDTSVQGFTDNDFLLEFHSHMNNQEITLSELLLLLGLPSLLCELDYSRKHVLTGKKTAEEHAAFFKENAIASLNKLSLKYHPDKHGKSDEIQKLINNLKAALQGIHDEVHNTVGTRYEAFGMVTVRTIVNAVESDRSRTSNITHRKMAELAGIVTSIVLGNLIKLRYGTLISIRNHFLTILNESLSNTREGIKSYVKNYKILWLDDLEEIIQQSRGSKIIQEEVGKLLKAAKKEYYVLEKCIESLDKKKRIKLDKYADLCFVQPIMYYADFISICDKGGITFNELETCTGVVNSQIHQISELSIACHQLIDNPEEYPLSKDEIKESLLAYIIQYKNLLQEKFKYMEHYFEREERVEKEFERIYLEKLQKQLQMAKEIQRLKAKALRLDQQAEAYKREAEAYRQEKEAYRREKEAYRRETEAYIREKEQEIQEKEQEIKMRLKAEKELKEIKEERTQIEKGRIQIEAEIERLKDQALEIERLRRFLEIQQRQALEVEKQEVGVDEVESVECEGEKKLTKKKDLLQRQVSEREIQEVSVDEVEPVKPRRQSL